VKNAIVPRYDMYRYTHTGAARGRSIVCTFPIYTNTIMYTGIRNNNITVRYHRCNTYTNRYICMPAEHLCDLNVNNNNNELQQQ